MTCSIGIAALDTSRVAGNADESLADMLDQADQALYEVKESGRNNFLLASGGQADGQPEVEPAPAP